MRYSVFVEIRMFATVEVEAEDHRDAAQKIALATLEQNFFSTTEFEVDGVECEVSTVDDIEAVNRPDSPMSIEQFDDRIVIFDEETIHGWLSPINGYTLNVPGGDM